MKRKVDALTIAGAVLVVLLVLFTSAGAPALMAFLASYGAATIAGTSAKKRLAGASFAGVAVFAFFTFKAVQP